MTPQCIHGFRTDECASCQTCPHGLSVARCGRCAALASSTRRTTTPSQPRPSQQYAGFEIFYDPAVSGWYYRAADGDRVSPLSYRSVFLARKAVDGLADGAKAPHSAKRS